MKRRRFLQITAAAAFAKPAFAKPVRAAAWTGRAFGADLAITLEGNLAADILALIRAEIAAIDATFSLYDATSELSRLNATGRIAPSGRMAEVLALADQFHRATGGRFDPTVQALWEGERADLVGWNRVQIGPVVRLGAGQMLTLNGIVQGYAADRVSAILQAAGYGEMLVDMGEFRATGRDYRLGIEDPITGFLGARSLPAGRALATSSPMAALSPHGMAHIVGPKGEALRWSTVVIEALNAVTADAASTAACLMMREEVEAMARAMDLRGALVDLNGDLQEIRV